MYKPTRETKLWNPSDANTELGKCTVLFDDNDFDVICGGNCSTILQEYFDCLGPQFYYFAEQLEEECDATTMSATL